MIYDNRLEVEGSRIDDATKAEMRDQVTRAVCGKAEMSSTLRFGASYRYTYVDSKDEPLMSIDVGEKRVRADRRRGEGLRLSKTFARSAGGTLRREQF
jgi:hypothetical protein